MEKVWKKCGKSVKKVCFLNFKRRRVAIIGRIAFSSVLAGMDSSSCDPTRVSRVPKFGLTPHSGVRLRPLLEGGLGCDDSSSFTEFADSSLMMTQILAVECCSSNSCTTFRTYHRDLFWLPRWSCILTRESHHCKACVSGSAAI